MTLNVNNHNPSLWSRREVLRGLSYASLAACLVPVSGWAAGDWNVQIGVCSSNENWDLIKAAGCEYVEDGVGKLLNPRAGNEDFKKALAGMRQRGAVVRACNGFLPGDMKLVGPDPRHDEAVEYARKAFERAKEAGIKYIVLGSGGARKIPEGFERSRAEDQFVNFLRKLAPVAADHGVAVAMESLNRSETNFGNTVAECLRYAKAVSHPGFKLTADMYHMLREDEGPQILGEAGSFLVHCHTAEKAERTPPGKAGDDFRPYLRALKKMGYTGGISLECRWKSFSEELAPAVKAFRAQIEAVRAEA